MNASEFVLHDEYYYCWYCKYVLMQLLLDFWTFTCNKILLHCVICLVNIHTRQHFMITLINKR